MQGVGARQIVLHAREVPERGERDTSKSVLPSAPLARREHLRSRVAPSKIALVRLRDAELEASMSGTRAGRRDARNAAVTEHAGRERRR